MSSENAYRPDFHYTPASGWINDPNGLVYYRGVWHLFYQYFNPSLPVEGMHWGHATSEDLLHWKEHEPAIDPDEHGHIFSGSAVVDADNASGLFDGGSGLVCAYTYWNPKTEWQCQAIASSPDAFTFSKYPGNPVIPELRDLPGHPADKDFRDPKIFWHAPTQRWIMVIAGGKLRFFTSTDLKHWEFATLQEEIWTECPDLFPLTVRGEPDNTKWILSGGGHWYQIGSFDGSRFTPESERIPMGAGPDFYATQSWDNAPDHRRVLISWMFAWHYDSGPRTGAIANPFPTGSSAGGCLTVPMEAELVRTSRGLRMQLNPVPELESLRKDLSEQHLQLTANKSCVLSPTGKAFDLVLETVGAPAGNLVIHIPDADGPHYTFGYDASEHALFIDRTRGACPEIKNYPIRHTAVLDPNTRSDALRFRALIDRNSIELFGQDGEVLLSAVIHPEPASGGLRLETDAEAQPCRVQLWTMKPAGCEA